MPGPIVLKQDAADHLTKARDNHRLYLKLKAEGEFLDWALTLLFYSALHLVQAYACQHGPWQPGDHGERKRYVREELRPLFVDYRDLQDRSEDVRYDLWPITLAEVQEWEDKQFGKIVGHLGGQRRGISLEPKANVSPPE